MEFNLQSMLKQAQQMQEKMEEIKKGLANKTITAESGGGMVRVVITGNNIVKEIKISSELINSGDVEMLEDLLVAAINKANADAANLVQQEMGSLGGMLPNIPGLNLPFNF